MKTVASFRIISVERVSSPQQYERPASTRWAVLVRVIGGDDTLFAGNGDTFAEAVNDAADKVAVGSDD